MAFCILALRSSKSTLPSSGILRLVFSFCGSYGFPSHCSLGFLPSREEELWKRSAALARLADVVAELTGRRGLEDRRGGDFCGRGATIFAESVWLFFEVGKEGGLYLRLAMEPGAAFSLA